MRNVGRRTRWRVAMPLPTPEGTIPFNRRSLLRLGIAGLVGHALPTARGEEPKPPFEMGEIQVIEPGTPQDKKYLPPPEIEILLPARNATFHPGATIDCVIRLILPKGRKALPQYLRVALKKG